MKLVALFAIAFMTLYCDALTGDDTSANFDSKNPSGYKACGAKIEIVVIDSCEYLYSFNYHATWMAHKGNCKNPIHLCK